MPLLKLSEYSVYAARNRLRNAPRIFLLYGISIQNVMAVAIPITTGISINSTTNQKFQCRMSASQGRIIVSETNWCVRYNAKDTLPKNKVTGFTINPNFVMMQKEDDWLWIFFLAASFLFNREIQTRRLKIAFRF